MESAGSGFIVGDFICQLAHATGRKFSSARQCLANVAWMFMLKGLRPIASVKASRDMPEETKACLMRLLDASEPVPARPLPRALARLAVRSPRPPQTHGRRSGLGSMPRPRRRKSQAQP